MGHYALCTVKRQKESYGSAHTCRGRPAEGDGLRVAKRSDGPREHLRPVTPRTGVSQPFLSSFAVSSWKRMTKMSQTPARPAKRKKSIAMAG